MYKINELIRVQYVAIDKEQNITDLQMIVISPSGVELPGVMLIETVPGIYESTFIPTEIGHWYVRLSSLSRPKNSQVHNYYVQNNQPAEYILDSRFEIDENNNLTTKDSIDIVPRIDETNSIGTGVKKWGNVWSKDIHCSGSLTDETNSFLIADLTDVISKKHLHEEYYTESLDVISTTSTYPNWINKININVTPSLGEYIFSWSFEITNSNAGGDTWVRIQVEGIDIHLGRYDIPITMSNSGWMNISGFKKLTLVGTTNNFLVDFCRQTGTAYLKNVCLFLRKIL